MKEGVILFSHFLGLGTNLMPQSQTCTDQKFWGRAFAHHLVLVIIHGAGTMYPKWQSLLTWHIFDGFKEWDLLLMAEILQVFDRYFLHNVPSVPHPFGARAGFFRRHQQRQTRKIESKNNYRQWYLAFFNGLNPTYLSLLRQSWRIGEGLGKLRWGTRGTRRQARGAGGWGLCGHGCGGGFASKPLVIENLRNKILKNRATTSNGGILTGASQVFTFHNGIGRTREVRGAWGTTQKIPVRVCWGQRS